MATEKAILFDLEYKGVQSFIAELEYGLQVPKCFVKRITKLIKKYYELDLIQVSECQYKIDGHFCSMPYNDVMVTLQTNKKR